LSERPPRAPDPASEARLEELRRQAEGRGIVPASGARPPGAPFPQASARGGYYGLPLLKPPQWTWEVPVYFFVGGIAGAAAVVAAVARLSGAERHLVRDAHRLAAAGALASPLLLISDLGRPERFLNMLRVFKPQSAMSAGSWLLFVFANNTLAAAAARFLEERFGQAAPLRGFANSAEAVSAFSGLFFANYTGVLLGATAIPAWSANVRTLPIHFAASGMGAAVSALELMGHDRSPALNALGIGSALAETAEGFNLESRQAPALRPLKRGRSGLITRAGGLLAGPVPLVLRLASLFAPPATARKMRRAAAASALAGSLLTRVGWIEAGKASAISSPRSGKTDTPLCLG
jgi:hypothetical protein